VNRQSLPDFDEDFRHRFRELIAWRRDVRRFQTRRLADGLLDVLLDIACLAPSVGNSQPWRFVVVNDPERRARVRQNFERCNAAALAAYADDRAALYAKLKLAGLSDAPSQVAVFVDESTSAGHQLGRRTMPETLQYSALTAVHTFWLAARAYGVGVGWVSILDPHEIVEALAVPDSWMLLAYLCVGYPEEEHLDPELERRGWQARVQQRDLVLYR
jgi:5,6-dimethylbenzimidazole synthase